MQQNLRLALDMMEEGIAMMRQNLRRAHPAETDAEIDARLGAWLRDRPGASHGDAEGTARTWEDWLAGRRSR